MNNSSSPAVEKKQIKKKSFETKKKAPEPGYDKIIQEKAQFYLKNARLAFKATDYNKAVTLFLKVHFLLPNYIEVLNELATTFLEMGDLSSAIQFYQKSLILKSDPAIENKLQGLLLKKGLLLLEIDEMNSVLDSFAEKKVENQGKEEGEKGKVIVIEDRTKNSQKEEVETKDEKIPKTNALEEHLKVKSEELIYQKCLLKAIAYLKVNFKNKALKELNVCLTTLPGKIEPYLLKGKILWSQNEITEAIKLIWKGYSVDSTHPEISEFIKIIEPMSEEHYEKAKRYLIQNEAMNTMNEIAKGLEFNPNHTQLLLLRAYMNRKDMQYENALTDLEMAFKNLKDKSLEEHVKSQIGLTYNEMGKYLFQKKRYDESLTIFTEALKFRPKDWGVLVNRGDCYKEINKWDLALEDYLAAEDHVGDRDEISTRIAILYNSIGIHFFNEKRFEKSLDAFNNCIKYARNASSSFYLNRAKLFMETRDIRLATRDLEIILDIEPDNREAALLLRSLNVNVTQEFKKPIIQMQLN